VAVICGALSNIVVLDVDPRHGGDKVVEGLKIPVTLTAQTGGGGTHFYFKGSLPTHPNIAPGVDLKGEGSCVMAPPSVHPSGNPYTWLIDTEPAPFPSWLINLIHQRAPKPQRKSAHWVVEALAGVNEGSRDDTCTRLAGYFKEHLLPQEVVAAMLVAWGQRCSPPFPTAEVLKCVKSVFRYPTVGPRKRKGVIL